ncbi:MAG TPA: extracellular solute-binding protein, partial [Stellaceae bacterium]|nr:extracellular solute-binding protein [Stellaceae bacterium]
AARVLPLALLADGVPIDQLYPIDIDRAFKSLDRLKPAIRVWWAEGQQSYQLLRDGEIDAIGIWNGRVIDLMKESQPVALVWNQAEIDRAYWVVSKGTPRAKLAWEFIQSAVRPERVAGFANDAYYGPINPKAFEFLDKKDAELMPTYPPNMKLAFIQDVVKSKDQIAAFTKRFDEWIAS